MTTREAQDAQVEGGMSNEHVHEALARSRFRVEIIVKIKYKSAFSYQRYHSPKIKKESRPERETKSCKTKRVQSSVKMKSSFFRYTPRPAACALALLFTHHPPLPRFPIGGPARSHSDSTPHGFIYSPLCAARRLADARGKARPPVYQPAITSDGADSAPALSSDLQLRRLRQDCLLRRLRLLRRPHSHAASDIARPAADPRSIIRGVLVRSAVLFVLQPLQHLPHKRLYDADRPILLDGCGRPGRATR